MKIKDVPQDPGIIEDYGHELCYAVDRKGAYDMVPSIGWEPKNIANQQAWEVIDKSIDQALDGIREGRLSPLAYYMAKHQMDVGLLAQYMGLFRWQVKRHLKPKVFRRLKESMFEAYAELFSISSFEFKSPLENQIVNKTGKEDK